MFAHAMEWFSSVVRLKYTSGLCKTCCIHWWKPLENMASVLLKELCWRLLLAILVIPQICPPFCNLSLSTKRRGGLYAGCDNFSRDYALPSGHEVIVGGGWGPSVGHCQVRGGEMLTTLAVGWQALALRSEEPGRFCKVAGVSIVDAGGPCSL